MLFWRCHHNRTNQACSWHCHCSNLMQMKMRHETRERRERERNSHQWMICMHVLRLNKADLLVMAMEMVAIRWAEQVVALKWFHHTCNKERIIWQEKTRERERKRKKAENKTLYIQVGRYAHDKGEKKPQTYMMLYVWLRLIKAECEMRKRKRLFTMRLLNVRWCWVGMYHFHRAPISDAATKLATLLLCHHPMITGKCENMRMRGREKKTPPNNKVSAVIIT